MSSPIDLGRFKMPAHGHDIRDGFIDTCQVCGSANLEPVIDLGHQPLCDSLLSREQLNAPEKTFPLRLVRCPDCTLNQLDYAVPGTEVYHLDYPYRSGITREVVTHMQGLAAECVDRLGLDGESMVLDIGCNDGTLLNAFKQRGVRTLGVEPTNVARIAVDAGVEVIQSFFTEELGEDIRKEHGAASCITATNVFAHMAPLGEVMRGVSALLADRGHFVCEVHYLPAILRKTQYDSIYHEHLRSYTLQSLVVLFHLYGFSVVHAEVMSRYSGTVRVFARKQKDASPGPEVSRLLAEESALGLASEDVYSRFRERVEISRWDLLELAFDAKRKGHSFVGNSCPGRCSTLINYVGIDRSLMPYICEQPTSLKLGLHLPGEHIPVVDNRCLEREQPDYIVLLAWHYAEPITRELRERGIRSRLVIPLPEVKIESAD